MVLSQQSILDGSAEEIRHLHKCEDCKSLLQIFIRYQRATRELLEKLRKLKTAS
jgi:hypothetical protein